MAGSCWRLLVFFSRTFYTLVLLSEIFVAAALPAQDVDRLPARGAVTVPILAPKLPPRQYPSSPDALISAPITIPPPILPRRYPVAPVNPGLPQDVFQQLVRTAGIIFSGRVISIGTSASSSGHDHDATSITFKVEHAMRGTLPNQSVTIHEWSGLWSRGENYRVGERVLLFLYGPSKLGLTSPVAGRMGRFAVDSQDRIVMSAVHIAAFAGNSILRGRPVVSYGDFALAIRNAQPEEWIQP